MVELLRRLRLEINSLTSAVRAGPQNVLVTNPILERIQDLVFTWSASVRPELALKGVPGEVLSRADRAFLELARLTGHRSIRNSYLAVLASIRKVLIEQVLLEVAKIPVLPQPATAARAESSLIPEIPDVPNELIPNALYGWVPKIREFLCTYSFDRNVFIMVAYRKRLAPLLREVKQGLLQLGLNPIVAKDHGLTDDLYNPIACLLACSYGVAIFDRAEVSQTHNPNVVYELGMMQILKRQCVILKHRQLKRMPSDLMSRLYEDYQSNGDAVTRIKEWWKRVSAH